MLYFMLVYDIEYTEICVLSRLNPASHPMIAGDRHQPPPILYRIDGIDKVSNSQTFVVQLVHLASLLQPSISLKKCL